MKPFPNPLPGTMWVSQNKQHSRPYLYSFNDDYLTNDFVGYADDSFIILKQDTKKSLDGGGVRVLCRGCVYLVDRNWWAPDVDNQVSLTRLL